MPKISQLTDESPIDLADLVPLVNASLLATRKATVGEIRGVDVVETYHANIVTPSSFKSPGLREPTFIENGALLSMAFTVGVDAAWRQFKIPTAFTGNPSVHVHWTKSSDANEAGKRARWRITYNVFNGNSEDASGEEFTVEIEQTYVDSGTTSRVVYRSSNTALSGFVAGQYVALRVEAIAPSQDAMTSEPALFSVDLLFDQKVFG